MNKRTLAAFTVLPTFRKKAERRADHMKVKYVRVNAYGHRYVRLYSKIAKIPTSRINNFPVALSSDANAAGCPAILSNALIAHYKRQNGLNFGSNNCTVNALVRSLSLGNA